MPWIEQLLDYGVLWIVLAILLFFWVKYLNKQQIINEWIARDKMALENDSRLRDFEEHKRVNNATINWITTLVKTVTDWNIDILASNQVNSDDHKKITSILLSREKVIDIKIDDIHSTIKCIDKTWKEVKNLLSNK